MRPYLQRTQGTLVNQFLILVSATLRNTQETMKSLLDFQISAFDLCPSCFKALSKLSQLYFEVRDEGHNRFEVEIRLIVGSGNSCRSWDKMQHKFRFHLHGAN